MGFLSRNLAYRGSPHRNHAYKICDIYASSILRGAGFIDMTTNVDTNPLSGQRKVCLTSVFLQEQV